MPRRTTRAAALPTYLEPQQIAALIDAAPTPQARVMMTLMWRAGLRVSEALAVRAADVRLDGTQPTLRVSHGKGGRPRMVPIHETLLPMLEGLRLYRDPSLPFVTANRSTVFRWVKKAVAVCVAAGTVPGGERIGPHTFRHSAARHWLASGIPINRVQRWLGHSRMQTTLIYLEILPDDLGLIGRVP